MRKIIFAYIFILINSIIFANDFYLYQGIENAVNTDKKIVSIDLKIGVDDQTFISEENPYIILIYDNDRMIWSSLNEIKEVFSKAEEWYKTAKANNVKSLNKEIFNDYSFVSSRGDNAQADIKYSFLLFEDKEKKLEYFITIDEIDTPSLKNEYINVYIHKLFIGKEAISIINSKLSNEGLKKLKKELSEGIEKRNKTLELFN